jgi:hypothetical protein
MAEYRLHWMTREKQSRVSEAVTLEADTARHGAALALRHFMQHGCEITTPLAHLDVTEPSGRRHTLLVDEVIEWLHDSQQAQFVENEHLGVLFQ